MTDAVISPSIEINGQFIPIMPESTMYRKGTGTVTCVAQSIGRGTLETVHKRNLTEAYGYLTFRVENTTANMQLINQFRSAGSSLDVIWLDEETNFNATMTNAQIVNEVERTLSSDGDASIEICGDQVKETF